LRAPDLALALHRGRARAACARARAQAVIRAVCAVIDAFHFPLPEDAEAAAAPAAAALGEAGPAPAAAAAAGPAEAAADAAREIQAALVRRVLPALQAQLVRLPPAGHLAPGSVIAGHQLAGTGPAQDPGGCQVGSGRPRRTLTGARAARQLHRGGEAVRAPVALALVKLLRHLPRPAARAALPRALQGVANLLRARLQRIRCELGLLDRVSGLQSGLRSDQLGLGARAWHVQGGRRLPAAGYPAAPAASVLAHPMNT